MLPKSTLASSVFWSVSERLRIESSVCSNLALAFLALPFFFPPFFPFFFPFFPFHASSAASAAALFGAAPGLCVPLPP